MGFLYRSAIRKRIACFFLVLILSDLGFPLTSYALTSGPSQPEFSSFEPVSTSQMVDEFSGDFTYNIPVLNIPGPQGSEYPLSLSYHSGATPEEEASWVGYGWTLNPGAINRNTRGFPDDFNKVPVTYHNKMPANWTVTAGAGLGVEVFSKDMASVNFGLRYNNYQGFGYNAGAGLSLGKGVVSLGYNVVDGNGSFSASVNPAALMAQPADHQKAAEKRVASETKHKRPAEKLPTRYSGNRVSLMGGNHGLFTYSEVNRASRAANYYGGSVNVSTGLEVNLLPIPAGQTTNISGSFAWQKNVERENLNAYGYMYSQKADEQSAGPDAIRDYFIEKETPYNKRDMFLGIPFNNADIFAVSGEGVGGSFRLYHEQIGEFVPNSKSSNLGILNVAPEISAGSAFGLGTDVGAGWQRLSEGPWETQKRYKFSAANPGYDSVFFRFANDMGGGSSADVSDEPVYAALNGNGLSKGVLTAERNKIKSANQLPAKNRASLKDRASLIGYHTVGDVWANGQLRRARRFSHRQDLPVAYDKLAPEAICEMSVATATGGRYIYGLPVLSGQEGNLQYGVQAAPTVNNYTVTTDKSDSDLDIKVGEERLAAYANSFPITEIRTPDYVDRTLDGPTADDFGGYTKFNYVKQYGGSDYANWYNWRVPYNGLLYQANSLSDRDDDMGVVSYGKKEVVYLQSIQTKTHTAIFVLADRDDSRDALNETEGNNSPRALTDVDVASRKGLKKLVRIDLYVNDDVTVGPDGIAVPISINANEKRPPIKSVRFAYNNTLFSATTTGGGLPNVTRDATGKRQGKLTLSKVWFEYQGIPTKISPYTFSYTYPSSYANYPTIYQPNGPRSVVTSGTGSVTADYYNTLSAAVQNPTYDPFMLDAWGNYRKNGAQRAGNLQSWLDQRDDLSWDPAAWQLKGITLPTGGQIQVQYEQDDYAYVQNKPVHAMVSLQNDPDNTGINSNRYYLNLATAGITTGSQKKATVEALRTQYLAGNNRKIFFKFLYNLTDNTAPTLNQTTLNKDYISGYATVAAVDTTSSGQLFIELDKSSKYTLPHQVCKNFVQTQRAGKLVGYNLTADRNSPQRAVRDLLTLAPTLLKLTSECKAINWGLSYFRIPLVKPKKGGGLRVKRLLTFDKTGLDAESNAALTGVLYGSEYLYQMRDAQGRTISSGVATTEPNSMREENILVDYLPRLGQSLVSKIISGVDRKQTEGPLGESLLPAPSIGYSRVVVRNIHSGRTSPGYSVSEFATARDYPMQVKYSALQSQTQFKLQTVILATNQVNNTYATQGYSFILNNMHGQVLRKSTYPGDYPGTSAQLLPTPTNEQKYTYYEPAKITDQKTIIPGDFIPLVSEQGAAAGDRFYPGREVDITMAQKAVKDDMLDLNVETDVTVGLFGLFPAFYAAAFPSVTRSEAGLYTHVTSKVVRYPAVVKRIESVENGIQHTTENIAFDKFSGQAVQTKATDEFKGGYVQEGVQAAWVRPEFGPKAGREGIDIPIGATAPIRLQTIGSELWLQFTRSGVCGQLDKITRGDHLVISSPGDDRDNTVFFADEPDYIAGRVRLYPASIPFTLTPASVTSSDVSAVRIVTSGRRNLLTAAAGATTYHGTNYAQLHTVAPFTTASKYGSDPNSFTAAINTWLGGSNSPTDKLPANNTEYTNINVSAFANRLNGCVRDPSKATISDLVLAKQIVNGKLTVSIISFKVKCDNGLSSVLIQNQ